MSYPRETKEFQPISVKVKTNGVEVEVFDGVEVFVTSTGERPTTDAAWAQPVTLDDVIGLMINEFEPALYNVWARVTTSTETVIVYCGNFRVTGPISPII